MPGSTATATRGKQEAKSLKAQDVICRATIACLYELGYAETSINRVVERAGLSKGALQHHFPTKEDLITAVAGRLIERSIERQRQMSKATGKRPTESVAGFLAFMWTELLNTKPYQALLEILNAARTDHKLRERLSPTLQHWNQTLERQVAESFEATGGSAEDVELVMVMSRCLMRGLIIQRQFESDPSVEERVIRRWSEIVAPLMRPRDPAQPGQE